MTLRFEPMTQESPLLRGRAVFLSASIPDPSRWTGGFDAREITDAVVAAARAVLTAGGTLVTAAHPTIAPLLLYVAGEFPRRATGEPPRVITYQSRLFADVLPQATRRFEESGVGELRHTPAEPGETPEPGRWNASLLRMREEMFHDTEPIAAIFVGGMEGISEEYELLARRLPLTALYPVGRPGGEAARLVGRLDSPLAPLLAAADIYPSLFRAVVANISTHLR